MPCFVSSRSTDVNEQLFVQCLKDILRSPLGYLFPLILNISSVFFHEHLQICNSVKAFTKESTQFHAFFMPAAHTESRTIQCKCGVLLPRDLIVYKLHGCVVIHCCFL